MVTRNRESHEFALHFPKLSDYDLKLGKEFTINQPDLVHRIAKVLRLQCGETIILFDAVLNICAQIRTIEKKTVIAEILEKKSNKQLEPHIIVLLPLLKKEALHDAIYSCTELGAQEIWLVETEKSQKLYNTPKDIEKLRHIFIAAAEQSKQFILPEIEPPRNIADVLPLFEYDKSLAIFCDTNGQPCSQTIEHIKKENRGTIILLIGPEGDLTTQEKELLKTYPFIFTHLTPTILRAQQAVTVSLGLLRTLL